MGRKWTLILVAGLIASISVHIRADEAKPPSTQPTTAATTPRLSEKLSVTEGAIKIGGAVVKYKATAGYLPVKEEYGKERANFFFIAYERQREADQDIAKRPITYVFNGGPGAAAVWLHLGTVGPYRVHLN